MWNDSVTPIMLPAPSPTVKGTPALAEISASPEQSITSRGVIVSIPLRSQAVTARIRAPSISGAIAVVCSRSRTPASSSISNIVSVARSGS